MYIIISFDFITNCYASEGGAWSLYKDVPIIFATDIFNLLTAEQIESHTFYDRVNKNGELPQCSPELVIYIHSVWVGQDSGEAY
jgi:hypothetical protein